MALSGAMPTARARRDPLTGLGLALAVPLLVLGLTLPVVSIDQFFVFRDEVSVLGGIASLAAAGEWPLAAIVAAFSIVFPVAKLILAGRLWWRGDAAPHRARWLPLLATLGKWSMLDVFLVALLVTVVKLSPVANITVEAGIYVFAAAVVVSTAAVHRLAARARA